MCINPGESFQLQMGFRFHSYVLTIYICLYWILELIFFYSVVSRKYIRKVSVKLVPKYFSRDCSTESFSCGEQKKRKKTRLKKGRNHETKFKTLLLSPIHLAHHRSAVAPLSLHCRSVVATMLHRYCIAIVLLSRHRCHSVVVLLLHRYRTTIAPLSLCCCRSCCRYAITPQSHRYCTTVALLMLLLLLLRRCTDITPLSYHCWTAVARAQREYKQIKIELLFLYCRFSCQSEGSHGCHLNRHSQGHSEHRWLSGVCVFLLRAVFDFAENTQGGNLSTLIIELSDRSWIRGIAEIVDNWHGIKITVVASSCRIE